MVEEKLSVTQLRGAIQSFLREHISGALATTLDNVPRCSPVQYFIGENLNIFILSAGGDKFKAIAQNPNVCLLVNTEYITYRKIKGVQIFGRAATSDEDPKLYDEALRFAPDPELMKTQRDKLKIIKILPEEITYLNALDGDRTKQILKDDEIIVKPD